MQPVKQIIATLLDNGRGVFRGGTGLLGIAYTIFLALWIGVARLFGERWWPSSVLLYLPAQVWLLPLVLLIPAALFFERRLLPILLFCVFLTVFCFAGFHLGLGSRSASAGSSALTLLTNNVGESHRLSMAAFVQEENPDLMVFQDAGRRGLAYRRAYPDRTVAAVGEYVLVSRFPVTSAQLLFGPAWRTPPAAKFRVAWPGHPFTLFSVHIPTPRRDFDYLRGQGFLVEFVRGGLWRHIAGYRESMQKRVEVARWLAEAMQREPGPVLAAGDFNMPGWGMVDSIFDSRLTDAFEACGRGFGFTFPGDTHNPLTLFGPWLRLDHIFCNSGWMPLTCQVEPRRRSQHRCVAARFQWVDNRH